MRQKRLKIAWFSPLNINDNEAGESVSAYVTDLLLPHLRGDFEIDLYCDGFSSYRDFPTYHYLSCFKRHKIKEYDIFFYQVEDRECSFFTRSHLGLFPGVVLLHDLLFKLEGPEPFHYSPWEVVRDRFRGAGNIWPQRGVYYKKKGPIGYREAGLSLVPVFSSAHNLTQYKSTVRESLLENDKVEDPKAFYLPYPAGRNNRCADNNIPVISYCGSVELEHRAHKVLKAVSELSGVRLLWLIAPGEEQRAKELIGEAGIGSCELIPARSPAKWEEVAGKSDIALHTLFSVYGDPGPYLPISLTAGVPSVVSNFAAADYMPDSAVFKVDPGENEAEQIKGYLFELLNLRTDNRKQWEALSESLCSYASEFHDPMLVAGELKKIFLAKASFLKRNLVRWEMMQKEAASSCLDEGVSLIAGCCDDDALNTAFGNGFIIRELLEPSFTDLGWKT